MTKRQRAIEWVKTVMIVLLTASAMLLAWRTELFYGFIGTIPLFGNVAELVRGASGVPDTPGIEIREAARPLSIVITNEQGERYGVKYDIVERNSVYEMTSSILGEALGSASPPEEITETEWRISLSGPGVFYEYLIPVRLSMLGPWLGVNKPDTVDDAMIRRVYIAFGEDKSRIYYQDIEHSMFFGSDTASAAGKKQELDRYSANDALFAFETGMSVGENAPYMLVMPDQDHPVVRASSYGSAEDMLGITLAAMGRGDEKYATYIDSGGTLVCVGTQFNIRVGNNGRVFYRPTEDPPQIGEGRQSVGEVIELARAIVASTIAGACGDAEVFLESYEYSSDGICTVFFSYYISGGRIHINEDIQAARIKLQNGAVLEAELIFREFTYTGEYVQLFPERQTLAAAGGEYLLSYSEAGQDVMQPSWVRS